MSIEVNFRLRKAFLLRDLEEINKCLFEGACVDLKVIPTANISLLHDTPNEEVTRLLLIHGADFSAINSIGQTPLHTATSYRKGLGVIRQLLLFGADVNAEDYLGKTPLHYALSYRNELGVVEELLKHGANVLAIDNKGYTPLHLAVSYNSTQEFIQTLLDFGADVTVKDNYNTSPFEAAVLKGDYDIAKQLIKITVFDNFGNDNGKINHLRNNINPSINHELLTYLDACVSEMECLKEHKTGNNQPLRSYIIRRGGTHKELYPKGSDVVQEIVDKYAIYRDVILLSIKYCLERVPLFYDLGQVQVYSRKYKTNEAVFLNCYCVHKIAEYLANDDLLNFISAFCKHFID